MIEEVQFAESIAPYVSMLVGLIISLTVKDFVTSFVKGLAFRFNPLFKEGDTIIVDGVYVVVVKIGIRNTVFGSNKKSGDYVWHSVPNERISYLKIEKIVIPQEMRHKNFNPENFKSVDNEED